MVAAAALLLASKFIESKQLKISHAIYMAGDQYSIAEMEDMEVKLLVALKWKLKIVTPYDFTSLLMKKLFPNLNLDCQKNIEEIVDYCLMDPTFLSFYPSSIAFGSMLIGLYVSDLTDEYLSLQEFIGKWKED